MAIDKDLNVRIDKHDDENIGERTSVGVRLPNGGVVVSPGTHVNANTQPLVSVYADDKGNIIRRDAPVQHQSQSAPAKRSKRRKSSEEVAEPAPQPARIVKMNIDVQGFGTIPSVYRHCWHGDGVIVLGLDEMSYRPPRLQSSAEGLQGIVTLSGISGSWGNTGLSFKDDDGIESVILIRVPEEEQEETEDDEQE